MQDLLNAVRATLRAKQVAAKLGIGLSSVWRLANDDPTFPKPFALSTRVTVWDSVEVDRYIDLKKAARAA